MKKSSTTPRRTRSGSGSIGLPPVELGAASTGPTRYCYLVLLSGNKATTRIFRQRKNGLPNTTDEIILLHLVLLRKPYLSDCRLKRCWLGNAARQRHQSRLQVCRTDADPPLIQLYTAAQLLHQFAKLDPPRLDLVHQSSFGLAQLAISSDFRLCEGFHARTSLASPEPSLPASCPLQEELPRRAGRTGT